MPTALITGAARGIGRALASGYLADGWRVLAVCRDPAALAGLDGIADAARLDVTDDEGIAALAERWRDERIDLLWNNAGVDSPNTRSLARLDTEEWARCLRVNTIAPVAMAAAFAGHVAASERRTMAFVTSQLGSISQAAGVRRYAYSSSKAGLNMAARTLALELSGRVRVAILHPGHVATDMGGRPRPGDAGGKRARHAPRRRAPHRPPVRRLPRLAGPRDPLVSAALPVIPLSSAAAGTGAPTASTARPRRPAHRQGR